MPQPIADTEGLPDAPGDAAPGAGADAGRPDAGLGSEPLTVTEDEAEVGLAQKGTGKAAVIRRETEI